MKLIINRVYIDKDAPIEFNDCLQVMGNLVRLISIDDERLVTVEKMIQEPFGNIITTLNKKNIYQIPHERLKQFKGFK